MVYMRKGSVKRMPNRHNLVFCLLQIDYRQRNYKRLEYLFIYAAKHTPYWSTSLCAGYSFFVLTPKKYQKAKPRVLYPLKGCITGNGEGLANLR